MSPLTAAIIIAAFFAAAACYFFWQTAILRKEIGTIKHMYALIESAPYYIAFDNPESDLYANPAACLMVGRPVGMAMSKESTHDETGMRILFEEAFPAVEKYGQWAGENTLLHTDGHLIPVQQFIFPVKDKNGTQLGLGTLMRDITAEIEMRRSFDIQRALLNFSTSFIVALDSELNVIYANPGAYEMTACNREEIGMSITPEMFHLPETCVRVRKSWEEAFENGAAEFESELLRKDGKVLQVHHSIFTIKIPGDTNPGLGVILSDITELKNTQQELLFAKEAAEAASRAKSAFLSNMSHEMRTPMNAIIGMTHIARNTKDPAMLQDSLAKVAISSEHLLNVINDVLDLSKIESGKLELYNKNFNLQKMLENAVEIVAVKAKEKSLNLTTTIEEGTPGAITGDANRLTQIVVNLLSNAVKFTGNMGNVLLKVWAEALQDDSIRLYISVSDDGIGMTEEQQSRLFQSFEQASATVSVKYGGTGLGLAISKRLAQMMNGNITATSTIGKGSCFVVEIICHVAAGVEETTETALQEPDNDFTGVRVLLAEDIEINREILRLLLAPTGIEIDEVLNGTDAVAAFAACPGAYKLIFMDIQMPEMDGYTATKAIRALPAEEAATVPIIAMTANAFAEDVAQCLQAGMNDHVSKPINIGQVLGILRRYLKEG